ncbi:hypothetical protein P152DRAFT_459585 [Eremomyces bilateralis CBS 781.70]|uniref:U6 snRNA phosphodiesterase 1 n=1 Tax=Eremomyces bilateralis CBS 781.70 TaxID=1392243 RepID=A0A6G1FZH1_9PEZI|nr:uncharacterized protein P152DRAFT_459585 [Eremomyces bilateralis CBS 781.70]KAF1811178.1 hypothetical protein P152DRAFT_459585 [Eremomyces bilateralis CBS 781.70]
MSLVAYPDSEDDDQPPATQNIPEQRRSLPTSNELKRKRSYHNDDGTLNGRDQPNGTLPALPAAFHDLYSAPVRTFPTSDPSLHGGRQRQTPHVEGNWNTHVYLECACSTTSPVYPHEIDSV